MALSSLNTAAGANKGRPVALLHPGTQVSIGIRFHILGADSAEYKRILRKQQLVLQEKQKKSRGRVYYQTPEEFEANSLELLTGLTTGWDEDIRDEQGNITGTRKEIELNVGEFVPFSPEACRKIYEDLGFSWIREQIDAEIGDRRDFLPTENKS